MAIILAENIAKEFGSVKALRSLSLSVEEGELFGLVGPDGAGKTSLIRIFISIMEATSGDAWTGGFHTGREPDRVKEQIGYMCQKFALYPDLTVQENLDFSADLYGVPSGDRKKLYDELLSISNLQPFRRRQAAFLSGGMKQKLALACALVHMPRILFLDEPTNGVDPVSRRDFWRILTELRSRGVTLFVSTAYLDEAERCSRIALLHEGRLLATGTPDELRKRMTGTLLEIRVRPARQALKALKQAFSPETVTLFGDRIHLATENPEMIGLLLGRILSGESFDLQSVKPIQPSLEDVFVSIVSAR